MRYIAFPIRVSLNIPNARNVHAAFKNTVSKKRMEREGLAHDNSDYNSPGCTEAFDYAGLFD